MGENIEDSPNELLADHPHVETAARVGYYLVLVAGALTPPVAGTVIGLERPVDITFAPGVSASTHVQFGETTEVDFGSLGSTSLPKLHHSLVFTNVAGNVQVGALNPDFTDQDSLGIYTALFRDSGNTIVKPIVSQVERDTAVGAATAAILEVVVLQAGLLGAGVVRTKKQRQSDKITAAIQAHEAKLAAGGPDTKSLQESFEAVKTATRHARGEHKPHPLRRKFVALATALGIIASGAAVVHHELRFAKPAATASGQPLNPALVKLKPKVLDGTTVFGTGAQYLINNGSEFIIDEKNSVDRDNATINTNIQVALEHLRQQNKLPYLNDPDYLIAADISDEHCNIANMSQVLPVVLHGFNVGLVINPGDTDVSTGTLPFENDCISTLAKALQPTKEYPQPILMVTVRGNHDGTITVKQMRGTTLKGVDGKTYHPFTVLDSSNNYQAVVDGLTFAGSSDPRQSVAGTPIQPAGAVLQSKLLAEQGQNLVKIACDIQKKTGIGPIELTHDPKAGYAAVAAGCVSMADSGHLHVEHLPYGVLSTNGTTEYVFNQGTSSGAGENSITEYAPPRMDAPVTMFVFDRRTQQPVGYYNLVIHPDLSVSLSEFQPMPQPEAPPEAISSFLTTYDQSDDAVPDTLVTPAPPPRQRSRHQRHADSHTPRRIARASRHGHHPRDAK